MSHTVVGPFEQLTGRLLAFCAHPIAAWRVVSPAERRLIVLAYFSVGFLAGLAGTMFWVR
jgi:hypothetical protein